MPRAIPGGELIDPYQGTADILAQRIDILREAAFIEDPLRMLRACQFAARFELTVSERTLSAMQAAAALVTNGITPAHRRGVDEILERCPTAVDRH